MTSLHIVIVPQFHQLNTIVKVRNMIRGIENLRNGVYCDQEIDCPQKSRRYTHTKLL